MFSVTYTGMNFLPLCTARVWPTNSGRIVDRRDQVLRTLRSRVRFIASIRFSSLGSTKGPFFTDRAIPLLYPRRFTMYRSDGRPFLRVFRSTFPHGLHGWRPPEL